MNPIPDDRFLIQLAPAHAAACQAFMMEFITAGESEYGWLNEYLESPTFSAYLDYLELCAMGEYKPEIYVPQTTFFLSDPQDRLLGISRLRHRLNPSLEIEGGHIGYAVRPSARLLCPRHFLAVRAVAPSGSTLRVRKKSSSGGAIPAGWR
ncbi:MAG: hypothetical protein GYA20_04740 [Chloroflexi bacterium]|nr:hypothetical protein [Chloroflexota bacterium]